MTNFNSQTKCKELYNLIKIGDIITVHNTVEAFYSNYGIKPYIALEPGTEATVFAVKSPNVRYSEAYKNESVVAKFLSSITGELETASVWYQNIDKVK
jgi:hypothetical protein